MTVRALMMYCPHFLPLSHCAADRGLWARVPAWQGGAEGACRRWSRTRQEPLGHVQPGGGKKLHTGTQVRVVSKGLSEGGEPFTHHPGLEFLYEIFCLPQVVHARVVPVGCGTTFGMRLPLRLARPVPGPCSSNKLPKGESPAARIPCVSRHQKLPAGGERYMLFYHR